MAEGELYSVDRLVEFGLSMAVATQMANAMNVGLENMRTPGTERPLETHVQREYYVAIDGKAAGPCSERELVRLIADGTLTRKTLVWKPGMSDWMPVEDVPDVLKLVALTPPPVPTTRS